MTSATVTAGARAAAATGRAAGWARAPKSKNREQAMHLLALAFGTSNFGVTAH